MSKLKSSRCSIVGVSILALPLASLVSRARYEGGAEARRLNAVTVTAPQRERKIQKVPIAVAALYPQ